MKNEFAWFDKFAHDLRNRLNGVVGMSQIMLMEDINSEMQEHVSRILKSGNDILVMIDNKQRNLSSNVIEDETANNFTNISTERLHRSFSNQPPSGKGEPVLVIDDEIENLEVLVTSLVKEGYLVETAQSFEEAIKKIEIKTPDIILLDVILPGLSGYEACQKFKSEKKWADIPIIFLSGVTALEGRLKAYESGGTDFILKPFYVPEVLAVVNTQISLIHAKKELQKYANSLENLVKERTDQLIHSDRMASLGMMSAGLAHEINNPLTFVKGNVMMLKKFEQDIRALVESPQNSLDPKKSAFIVKEMPKALDEMLMGIDRISTIISGLKMFARQDTSEQIAVTLTGAVEDALTLVRSELKNKVEVINTLEKNLPLISGNLSQLTQVFVNLFVNAAHSMAERKPSILKIESKVISNSILILVSDTGCGISKENLEKIWNPFFTTKPKGIGTGLGLSIVHGIIREHQGDISVESNLGEGTTFKLSFPILRKTNEN